MLNHLFSSMTDWGDSAVTSLLALLFSLILLGLQQKRAAGAMALVFVVTAFGIAASKLVFYSQCVSDISFLGLRSPSGHSAMSVAVYGLSAAIISSSLAGKAEKIPYLIAVPFIVLIAASRVWIGAHTIPDVAVGSAWGFAVAWSVWRLLLKGHAATCPWWSLTGFALAVLALLHGTHFPAEQILRWVSGFIRGHLLACPE